VTKFWQHERTKLAKPIWRFGSAVPVLALAGALTSWTLRYEGIAGSILWMSQGCAAQ
jgi:hypothetical protein